MSSFLQNGCGSTVSQLAPPVDPTFRRLLTAVGSQTFYRDLATLLGGLCGCEHIHIFRMDNARPIVVSSISVDGSRVAERQFHDYMRARLWDGDTGMMETNTIDATSPALFRTNANQMSTIGLRDFFRREKLAERLMLCSREEKGLVALNVAKLGRQAFYDAVAVDRLAGASGMILSLISKHIDLMDERHNTINALTSLPTIESMLLQSGVHLPPRELQVCSRFIYGLSATAIASDLNLARETVTSYRKRIYRRLSVTSHRELLLWYVELCCGIGEEITEREYLSV